MALIWNASALSIPCEAMPSAKHVTLRLHFHYFSNHALLEATITSYAEYVEQIAKLQSLAEISRKDEINGAIQKIKDLMQLHGVTVDDLSSGIRSKAAKAKGTVAAQFRAPLKT